MTIFSFNIQSTCMQLIHSLFQYYQLVFLSFILQVCPPGLHISLGLFLKHFNSMEKACHQLDLQTVAYLAPQDNPVNLSKNMIYMVERHRLEAMLAEKEEERKELMEQLSCFILLYPEEAASQPVQLLQESVKEKDSEINDVVRIDFFLYTV